MNWRGMLLLDPEMSYIGYAGKFDVGKRMVEGTGEDEKEVLVLGTEGLGNIRIGRDGKGRLVRVKWARMAQR
jgi:hypothetical protein